MEYISLKVFRHGDGCRRMKKYNKDRSKSSTAIKHWQLPAGNRLPWKTAIKKMRADAGQHLPPTRLLGRPLSWTLCIADDYQFY